MRIGLHINNFTWPGGPQALRERLAEVVRTADDAGFSFITVMDHFFQIGAVGTVEMEMLEGYSALAYLAGATKRVRLGTMVTGVTYRYPGVLIKTVTTLDVRISEGERFLALAQPGSSASMSVWASPIRYSKSALSAWRKPFRSRSIC